VILDTPGQIEIFTWSASGAIITDAIASAFPAVVAYVIDTPRTAAPATFMSNMLYACSILYKTRLPFILVFNKTDVQRHEFALEWMNDFEVFQAALAGHSATTDSEGEPTYMSSLMNSMSLVLDEFYKNLKVGLVIFCHLCIFAHILCRLLVSQVLPEMASKSLLMQLTIRERITKGLRSSLPFSLHFPQTILQRVSTRTRTSTRAAREVIARHEG